MINSDPSQAKDFFINLWKCPYRRWGRYARRILLIFMMGTVVWGGLNLGIAMISFPGYLPLSILMLYTTLTTGISCLLAIFTHYLQMRKISRFKLVRVFRHEKSLDV